MHVNAVDPKLIWGEDHLARLSRATSLNRTQRGGMVDTYSRILRHGGRIGRHVPLRMVQDANGQLHPAGHLDYWRICYVLAAYRLGVPVRIATKHPLRPIPPARLSRGGGALGGNGRSDSVGADPAPGVAPSHSGEQRGRRDP